MACRVTSLILALSMHAGIGTGQMCPSVGSWSVALMLLCRPSPPGPSRGARQRFPGCSSTGIWASSLLQMDGRTRTSSGSSHRGMRACCRWEGYYKHLSVRVKRMLVLTALRPLLEYGAEVLVPTSEHCRALESVQLKAARIILRCPPRTSSDVTRADMGLQLLSSRRDIAKLKWQH